MSAIVRRRALKSELFLQITARPGTEVATKPLFTTASKRIWPHSIRLIARGGKLDLIYVEGLGYRADGQVGKNIYLTNWNWPKEIDKIPDWIQEIVWSEGVVAGFDMGAAAELARIDAAVTS